MSKNRHRREINYGSLQEDLIEPVQAAGHAIMRHYNCRPKTTIKPDGSPVSEADKEAEKILIQAISSVTPDIKIISEENVESHSLCPEEAFFLVDPLDGTKEFLNPDGGGAFTVNIGLVKQKRPVMGIVYAPALDRLFYGSAGLGSFELSGGKKRKISVRKPSEAGLVAVTSASHLDPRTKKWLKAHNVREVIGLSSSIKFCLIAAGEIDAYPRYGPTMEWDTAAGDAVLCAAGGSVKDEEGYPIIYGKRKYRNVPFFATGF